MYIPDAVVQTRLDSRVLATLLVAWDKQGWRPESRSQMVATALEFLVDLLVSSGRVEKVEFTEDAKRIIESVFPQGVQPGKRQRGKRALMHNLQQDQEVLSRLAIGRGKASLANLQFVARDAADSEPSPEDVARWVAEANASIRKGEEKSQPAAHELANEDVVSGKDLDKQVKRISEKVPDMSLKEEGDEQQTNSSTEGDTGDAQ